MGLWLLQESLRDLGARRARPSALPALLAAAAELPAGGPIVRPGRPVVPAAGRHAGPDRRGLSPRPASRPPATRPALVRCILDSLAAAFARAVRDAARLSGRDRSTSSTSSAAARATTLLCQLTADACGLPVVAGPVEATALGNVLVQARAHGLLAGRSRGRSARSSGLDARTIRRFEPRDRAGTARH